MSAVGESKSNDLFEQKLESQAGISLKEIRGLSPEQQKQELEKISKVSELAINFLKHPAVEITFILPDQSTLLVAHRKKRDWNRTNTFTVTSSHEGTIPIVVSMAEKELKKLIAAAETVVPEIRSRL